MPERNITFEIKEHLGTIAKYGTGWNKELNIISWNGGTPKFDIRDWDEHHEKMSRGVTLNQWEMRKMVDLYIARNNAKAVDRGKAIEAQRNARKEAAYQRREETLLEESLPVEEAALQAVVDMETGEVIEGSEPPLLDPQGESDTQAELDPKPESDLQTEPELVRESDEVTKGAEAPVVSDASDTADRSNEEEDVF